MFLLKRERCVPTKIITNTSHTKDSILIFNLLPVCYLPINNLLVDFFYIEISYQFIFKYHNFINLLLSITVLSIYYSILQFYNFFCLNITFFSNYFQITHFFITLFLNIIILSIYFVQG